MKKLLSIFVSLALLLSLGVMTASAAEVGYSDTDGHWAASVIKTWTGRGIIQGSEGKFRPDDPITRGEFAVILDRIMAYKTAASNKFTDLSSSEFYTDAVLKAANYGVLTGYPDKTVKPTADITRQEAFVMLYRAFQFAPVSGYIIKANDAADVSDYAKDAVSAFESLKIIQGRGDGNIYPAASITRSEIIKILDNFISEIYNTAGTYSANADKYVVINVPGVVLKDMSVAGSVVVAPGVGTGDLTLNSVKVKGNVIVLGGGVHSIVISGSSTVDGIVHIVQQDGEVRVYNSSGNLIACEIANGSNDVTLEGTFSEVSVDASVNVNITGSTKVTDLVVNAGATINASGTVSNIAVNAAANINASGTVTNLTVNAPANIAATGTIKNLEVNATANVTGTGTIEKATVSTAATGSSFEKSPTTVTAPEGVNVTIGGTNYTSDGKNLNQTNSGGGGGGGGGGGSGGGSSVTTSSVTLYLNHSANGITSNVSSNSCTFDLSSLTSYPDSTIISDIMINTSSASTYSVGNYSINTNTMVPMSTFLGFLGLTTDKNVTLGKIRDVSDTCSVTGSIANGDSLNVTFNVGSGGYYSLTNSGTTITADLKTNAKIADVRLGGSDPVALLVKNITDRSCTYTLSASRNGTTVSKTYPTYSSISGLSLSQLVSEISSKFPSIDELSDLTGITVAITYGSKTVTLIFS